MLSDQKVLVTGASGQIGLPLVRSLTADNEVWALARFADRSVRQRIEQIGARTCSHDLGSGDLEGLPGDFTYVLHLAAFQGRGHDYLAALRTNAEGTGFLMQHCRRAKAFLVMSTTSVYDPHPDPFHLYRESDPLGDAHVLHSPTYSVSKIGQEAVARYCARSLGLRTVLTRMNVAYGPNGGLPAIHLDMISFGAPVKLRWDPCPYSPIHQDDINRQVAPLLDAASVPALTVNWCGDNAVSAQEWCRLIGELTGIPPRLVTEPVAGTHRGLIGDPASRFALTGRCEVPWQRGIAEMVKARHA